MDLVLFDDAIQHVARISRVVQNKKGHALLVGVGGSGKQSLARLSAHICGYAVVQIVISSTYSLNDFKADLQVVRIKITVLFTKAGVKQEKLMFLFNNHYHDHTTYIGLFHEGRGQTGEVDVPIYGQSNSRRTISGIHERPPLKRQHP